MARQACGPVNLLDASAGLDAGVEHLLDNIDSLASGVAAYRARITLQAQPTAVIAWPSEGLLVVVDQQMLDRLVVGRQ